MDLHPYDGIERRFRHTDHDRAQGIRIVAGLLGLDQSSLGNGLFYDLSFYSGGSGVYDRLAISLPSDEGIWSCVIQSECFKNPEELLDDPAREEDFRWLLDYQWEGRDRPTSAVDFINAERAEFQARCLVTDRLLFEADSEVNNRAVFWGDASGLNYLAFNQG